MFHGVFVARVVGFPTMTVRRPLTRLLAALGVALTVLPSLAAAQVACNGGASCALTVTLRLGRPQVFRLALSDGTTTVPPLSSSDFATGFKDVAGPTVSVLANSPYRITVQAAFSTWQYSGSQANPAKGAADLQWSRSASGPWFASSNASTLWPASGSSAPATAGTTVPLFYRTLWQWTSSPPGTYALPVNITLTSP